MHSSNREGAMEPVTFLPCSSNVREYPIGRNRCLRHVATSCETQSGSDEKVIVARALWNLPRGICILQNNNIQASHGWEHRPHPRDTYASLTPGYLLWTLTQLFARTNSSLASWRSYFWTEETWVRSCVFHCFLQTRQTRGNERQWPISRSTLYIDSSEPDRRRSGVRESLFASLSMRSMTSSRFRRTR